MYLSMTLSVVLFEPARVDWLIPVKPFRHLSNGTLLRRVPFSWLVFSNLSLIQNIVEYSKNHEMSQLIEEPT